MAPIFLNRAYYSVDYLERLKWVTTFLVTQLHLSPMQSKPFNPILGETFQVKVGDCDMYYEQIMNKPPTCAFYCTAPTYSISGHLSIEAKTMPNSCKACKYGKYTVTFSDGHSYELQQAPVIIKGLSMGQRTFNYRKCSIVIDKVRDFLLLRNTT